MNKSLLPASVAIIAGVAVLSGNAAADQNGLVANTAIDGPVLTFDWPAIEVGVGSYEEGPTGVTVIRFPKRASLAVDVRGGGPGTVNTDLLRLGYSRPFTDAIVFSGGSAYGEEAITAVATGLKDDGVRSGDISKNDPTAFFLEIHRVSVNLDANGSSLLQSLQQTTVGRKNDLILMLGAVRASLMPSRARMLKPG